MADARTPEDLPATDTPPDDAHDGTGIDDTGIDDTGQLALATPAAHVCVVLDRHTREIGLAHVAAIKRQLAASAARRAAAEAGGARRSGRAA